MSTQVRKWNCFITLCITIKFDHQDIAIFEKQVNSRSKWAIYSQILFS